MMETKLALAMIVQRYRVELRPGAKIELDPTVTLRPRGSVPMFLKRV
jgi:cytochrome P450